MAVRPHASGIARSFTAAAADYDRWAEPQRLGAERLAALLPSSALVRSILDVGCGTGLLLRLLHQRFPDASLAGVDVAPGMIEACRRQCSVMAGLSLTVSDIEEFDSPSRYDLIASSFCLQWLRHREATIGRLCHLLRPAGIFAAAIPVSGSLAELAESYRRAIGSEMPGLDFVAPDTYLHALEHAGLTIQRAEVSDLGTWFHRGIEVLRYFQATGAQFRHQPGYRPRSVPEIRRLIRQYETAYADSTGRIPVTYQVLYLQAVRRP